MFSVITLRARTRILAATFMAALFIGMAGPVNAAALGTVSMELGDPRPGENTTYSLTASNWSATPIACVEMVFSDSSGTGGTAPAGLSTTATPATFDSATVVTNVNWAVSSPAADTVRITNSVTTEAPLATGNITWGNIVNGNTVSNTYFGLITTYTDAACTGGNEVDTGVAVFEYKDGTDINLVIDPILSMSCAAVGSGLTVNNALTTQASTATLIDYGTNVTASSNGITAHDVTATTNASGGYIIYLRQAQEFQNPNSDTITVHSGTNGTPSTFTAAGTESWGYTTEDSTLTGGTADRFTSAGGDKWAGFSLTNQPIMSNTNAVPGSETERVGQQVGIASTTEFGVYSTTLIFTIVATF